MPPGARIVPRGDLNRLPPPLSLWLAGAGERTEDVISRALFYDMLDKANLHSTYKGLLGSIGVPSKGLKSVSRLVMEKSKPPWPLGGASGHP